MRRTAGRSESGFRGKAERGWREKSMKKVRAIFIRFDKKQFRGEAPGFRRSDSEGARGWEWQLYRDVVLSRFTISQDYDLVGI